MDNSTTISPGSFRGFTLEEVRNCQEKYSQLKSFVRDDTPIIQKSFNEISYALEQKLFNFYLYKRNSKHNDFVNDRSVILNLGMPDKIAFPKENSDSIIHKRVHKRKYSILNEEYCDEASPLKTKKLNEDDTHVTYIPYTKCSSTDAFINTSPAHNFATKFMNSCPKSTLKSSTSPINKTSKLHMLNSNFHVYQNKDSCEINANKFSVVKQWQGPFNCSIEKSSKKNTVKSDLLVPSKSFYLRESKLNVKEEDRELLKTSLVMMLKDEMTTNSFDHYVYRNMDGNLPNISRLVKCQDTSGTPTSRQTILSGDADDDWNISRPNVSDQSQTNWFNSLSEEILSKVRLLASSMMNDLGEWNSPMITEMILNDGFVILPDLGTAVITSSQVDVTLCLVCGSSGRLPEDKLLFCNSCCEPYHKYCLGFRISDSSSSNWICVRCQKYVCNKFEASDDLVIRELCKIFGSVNHQDGGVGLKLKCKRRCTLCFKVGDLPSNLGGRLLYVGSNQWVHANCILWSEGVREKRDGYLVNVRKTILNSKSKPCVRCRRPGASLRCAVRSCPKRFHFACALGSQCLFGKNMVFHCPKHASNLRRDNIAGIFRVKRKIFARDVKKTLTSFSNNKSVIIGSLKLIGIMRDGELQHGYRSRRKFWSTRDPRKICTYFCNVFEVKKKHDRKKFVDEERKVEIEEAGESHKKLVRYLKELKMLKMDNSKKRFERFVQLDGTAGVEDSDEDDDEELTLHNFSDAIRHDDDSNETVSDRRDGNFNCSFQDFSSYGTPFKPIVRIQEASTSSFVSPAIFSANSSKSRTPLNYSTPLSRATPTPAKFANGEVSYIGSVVALNLQSLLKPKPKQDFSPRSQQNSTPMKDNQNRISTTKSTIIESPLKHNTNSPSKASKTGGISTGQIFMTDLTTSEQSIRCSSTSSSTLKPLETTPKSTRSSSDSISVKGRVNFLGCISGTNLYSVLKPKEVNSSPLNVIKFPNLRIMSPPKVHTTSTSFVPSDRITLLSSGHSTSLNTPTPMDTCAAISQLPTSNICDQLTSASSLYVLAPILTDINHQNSDEFVPATVIPGSTTCLSSNTVCPIPPTPIPSPHITSTTINVTSMTINISSTILNASSSVVDAIPAAASTSSVTSITSPMSPLQKIQPTLLKPAVGFDHPQPFTSGELMFSDSDDDHDDIILNSRVFTDFNDFVKNFDTKTNSIGMPVLNLRRCDHLIASKSSKESSSSSSSSSSSFVSFKSSIIDKEGTQSDPSKSILTTLSQVPISLSPSLPASTTTTSMGPSSMLPRVSLTRISSSAPSLTSSVTLRSLSSSSTSSSIISATTYANTPIITFVTTSSASLSCRSNDQPSTIIKINNSFNTSDALRNNNSLSFSKGQTVMSSLSSATSSLSSSAPATLHPTCNARTSLTSLIEDELSQTSGMSCNANVNSRTNDDCGPNLDHPTSIIACNKKAGRSALDAVSNSPRNDNNVVGRPLSNDINSSDGKSTDAGDKPASEKVVIFEIKSSDGFSCSGNSAEEAWSKVKTELEAVRHKLSLKPITIGGMRGVTFFGLDHPVIINLIHNWASKSVVPGRKERELSEKLAEVKEGCARFMLFSQRKPLDVFHFLSSDHRRTINEPHEGSNEDDDDDEFSRPSTSTTELPLSIRYKNMRSSCPTSVSVLKSRIHGRGLFAMRDMENGELVIEYCGQVIRPALTDIREKMYESKGIGCYMFKVDDGSVVDATMKGNAARFINHSCDPNCTSKIVRVGGAKHIIICATRLIRRGEELTYNYKFPIEEGNKIPCSCGSRKCKKFMN